VAELKVLAHDLAATEQQLRPRAARLEEIAGEVDFLHGQIDAADADITDAAERLTLAERELAAMHKEEELLAQRVAALAESAAAAQERLTAMGPSVDAEIPELPPLPQAPVHARVAVETLRRERVSADHRVIELRDERDALAAHDPVRLREDLAASEAARTEAEAAVATADAAFAAAAEARDAAATAEREAAEREAAVNKSWRDASTALDELRQRYEEDDRARGDIERRIAEAERLLREGFQADPAELVAALTDEDSVETIEKRQELVQRRLALLGRVLPLGIIETSHLLGSMAGAGLLLLSQGLARRLDAAHALTVIAVAAGIVASLFKGGDYEEALLLLALLLVLLRARPAFSRKRACSAGSSTIARTDWRLTSHRRFVMLFAWLTFCPCCKPLPQMSHVLAIIPPKGE